MKSGGCRQVLVRALIFALATSTPAMAHVDGVEGETAGGGGGAVAKQPVPGAPTPIAVGVDIAFRDVVGAYTERATCERVAVGIRRGVTSGSVMERADSVLIAIDPGKARDRGDARVYVEAGELRLWFAKGKMIALHAADSERYLEADVASPPTHDSLRGLLPPLPLPHFDLIAAGASASGVPVSFTPYASRVAWQSATVDNQDDPKTVTIRGQGPMGEVVVTSDAKSGRFKEAVLSGAEVSIRLLITPQEPMQDAAWEPHIAARKRIDSLADFRPGGEPTHIGRAVLPLTFVNRDDKAVALAELIPAVASTDASKQSPAYLALLLTNAGAPPGTGTPQAVAAWSSLSHAARSAAEPNAAARLVARPVLVFDVAGGERTGGAAGGTDQVAKAATERWGPDMLWVTSYAGTLGYYAPGAAAAVLIVDDSRIVRDVIPLQSSMSADQVSTLVSQRFAGLIKAGAPAP